MARFRPYLLIATWAAFIWMMISAARRQPVSESFLINFGYIAGLIVAAILLCVAILPILVRRLQLNTGVAILFGILILCSVVAIDAYWLRDVIRTFG